MATVIKINGKSALLDCSHMRGYVFIRAKDMPLIEVSASDEEKDKIENPYDWNQLMISLENKAIALARKTWKN